MHRNILTEVYGRLDKTTPLKSNCGLLCQARCCQGDDAGMWLLPGERELLHGQEGYRFLTEEDGDILLCNNHCQRDMRPFACRIFPLFPLVRLSDEGKFTIDIIYDPRASSICPLAEADYPLRSMFRYLIHHATTYMLRDPELAKWWLEHSSYLEALMDIQSYQ